MGRAWVLASVSLALVVSPSGCSSFGADALPESPEAGPEAAPAPMQDAAMPDAGAGRGPTSPYGDPYPTSHLGYRARTTAMPGDVIPNLKLTGYAEDDGSTSTIQLADLYRPKGQTHDIITIVLCASWEPAGKAEMMMLAATPPARVAIVAALGEGNTRKTGATLGDLADFRNVTGRSPWTVLDPEFITLTPFYVAPDYSLPFGVIIDARTMEIVAVGAGAPPDPKRALDSFRASVLARQPSY